MKENRIMNDIKKFIEEDLEKDYSEDFSDVNISPEIYNRLKNAAAEIDKKHIERRKKNRVKRFVQVAACFIVMFSVITFTVPEVATAMKALFFDVNIDEEGGGIVLKPQKNFDLLNEWDEYYYPEYIPEGFELEVVDDEYGREMIFMAQDNDIIIEIDEDPLNASISHDTDTASVENIRINGWDGYLFVDEEHLYVDLILYTDINITGILMRQSTDKEIVIDIAESLKLIRNE